MKNIKEVETEVLAIEYHEVTGIQKEIILSEIMARMEGMMVNLCKDYWNIPNMDFEDKHSELQIELVRVLDYFKADGGAKFSTLCNTFFRRKLDKIYVSQTRQKRTAVSVSLEYILTENGDREIMDREMGFSIEEYSDIELYQMLDKIGLSEKEYMTCELIMQGVKKVDIARSIGVTPTMIRVYLDNVGKKMLQNQCYAL